METVSFFTFLEEKITEILFQLFFLALVAFLLIFYGVDTLFVVLLVILFISIQGLFQWCLYRKKRKASQHIIDLVDGLEETYYIADVLPKPKEFQNEAYYYALKKACKSMNDEIGKITEEKQDYQEYVESFAHEIKIPIGALSLTFDNTKNYTLKKETDKIFQLVEHKIYSKYYDEVVLLLETGLRISEFCGLTTHIDMQNRILNIDHQLLKDSEIGYYIETPKTKNGKRELPLTERAYQAIQRILKNRGKAQPLIVGGYSNFLFLNREGLPKVVGNYEGMVRGLIKKYNKYHTDKLPNITPHSFRHTYCTNMANRGMNPNTLQYLMGHANITMTLGYYAHGTFQSAKAELERLAC